jgi:diguanylate cyclase (GGDEF)-like protein
MSAVAHAKPGWTQRRPLIDLSALAQAFLLATITLAGAAAVLTSLLADGRIDWPRLAIILAAGAVAHAFAVKTPGNQVFHSGLAFAVAAAVLLPPQGIVLVCIAQHATDWVRQRYPWYIQSFNIANYTLSALSAWAVHDALVGLGPMSSPGLGRVLAASACGATFVLVNHAMLAPMLKLARGHSLESTGLFAFDGVLTDLVLAAIGITVALALATEPAAALIAALPLVVLHRVLAVPNLRAQALRDHKTGLLNARGIDERANEELARARRFGRPLSLLMIDIDNLRSINNRYGHLAGDAVLVAVADSFNASMRDYDLCARFGGDEFVILLPETPADQALEIAERVKAVVGRTALRHDDSDLPIGISVGVATLGRHDQTLADLMRRADTGTYASKAAGGHAVSFAAAT